MANTMELLTKKQVLNKYCYEIIDKETYDSLNESVKQKEMELNQLRLERDKVLNPSFQELEVELEDGTKGVLSVGLRSWTSDRFEFRKYTKSGEPSKVRSILYNAKFKILGICTTNN